MKKILALVLLLSPLAARAAPQIVPGSVKTGGTTDPVTSFSLPAVAAPAGANQVLFVCASERRSNTSLAPHAQSVTWNGRALVKLGRSETTQVSSTVAELWALENPEATTATVGITVDNAAYFAVSAFVVSGVQDIGTMLEHAPLSDRGTELVLPGAAETSLLLDCTTTGHGGAYPAVQAVGQTERSRLGTAQHWNTVSDRVGPGALGWRNVPPGDTEATRWAQVLVELQGTPETTPQCPVGTVPGCVVPPQICAETGPFLPLDGGWIDVTAPPYSARCDGVADDTAALQAAIAGIETAKGAVRNLLLPAGTCLVSDQLRARRADGWWVNNLSFYGRGRGLSRIQAADHAPAFQGSPRALVYMASEIDCGTSACSEDPSWVATGSGNKAFYNRLQGLTVSCGSGNPGCVGVDYLASNVGAIRDVEVLSEDGAAATGISMKRYGPGPGLLSHVQVEGFEIGIDVAQLDFSMTLEDVACAHVGTCVRNASNSLAIRHLTSDAPGPSVVQTNGDALTVLIDSAGTVSGGQWLVRTSAGESVSSGPYRAHGSDLPSTLNLPVQETPTAFASELSSQRANCEAFGSHHDDGVDDTAGLRAAMSTGRPIAYCTGRGIYHWDTEISIPASTRVVDLLGASVRRTGTLPKPSCLLRVDEPGEPLTIRRAWITGYDRALCITAARTVVVEDTGFGGGSMIEVAPGAGPVYLVDSGASRLLIGAGAKVYARQFNPELGASPMIDNAGRLWVLGLKTEGGQLVTLTRPGGCTEILGGLLYPVETATQVAHEVQEGGQASFAFAETSYSAGHAYPLLVRETRGGQMLTLAESLFPARGGGRNVPLLSARSAGCGT